MKNWQNSPYFTDEDAVPLPWASWSPKFRFETGRPLEMMYRYNPVLQWIVDEQRYTESRRKHYGHRI